MPRRLIDLSVALDADIASDPPGYTPEIEYVGHTQSAADVVKFFPGLTEDQLPGREGWAIERLHVMTHNGTHVDAPWHYATTQDGGMPALKIDEVPLDWFLRPGVKLDFRHLEDGHVVSAAELEAELARIGHDLRPLDIVLGETPAPAPPMAGRTMSPRVAAWAARRPCG